MANSGIDGSAARHMVRMAIMIGDVILQPSEMNSFGNILLVLHALGQPLSDRNTFKEKKKNILPSLLNILLLLVLLLFCKMGNLTHPYQYNINFIQSCRCVLL